MGKKTHELDGDMRCFGAALRIMRHRCKLTLHDVVALCAKSGWHVHTSNIADFERGDSPGASFRTVYMLARVYVLSLDDLEAMARQVANGTLSVSDLPSHVRNGRRSKTSAPRPGVDGVEQDSSGR